MDDPPTQPLRIILNAVEGFGKTTIGAGIENSAIIMAKGETGYLTLLDRNLAPKRPYVVIDSWPELLAFVRSLESDTDNIKTLVFDALGGFERLCHEYECDTRYDGKWGEDGFIGWQRGYDTAAKEWLKLLVSLDRLRDVCGMSVVILSHTQIRLFKNPDGPDFDRYETDCHRKTFAPTLRWADVVLFGKFLSYVTKTKGDTKAKGAGGTSRVIYTERRDTHDAKNRANLPEIIEIPNDRDLAWPTLKQHLYGENK